MVGKHITTYSVSLKHDISVRNITSLLICTMLNLWMHNIMK